MDFLEANESTIRLAVFAGGFALLALLEAIMPRKPRALKRTGRWLTNWALVILDTALLRVLVPVLAVGFATIAAGKGWGLLNLVALPGWLEIIAAMLLLDMLIYAQHVAFHHVPLFWRVHKVHHADRDMDVTTAIRFHPIEIILSMVYKLACIALIGPAAVAVLLFEITLNASAMFNHANIRLPARLDTALRALIITPDMHRVHHSVVVSETNSNYGFFLSIWDRLFSTYTAQPAAGHDGMHVGLSEYQTEKPAALIWSLALPFMPAPKSDPETAEPVSTEGK